MDHMFLAVFEHLADDCLLAARPREENIIQSFAPPGFGGGGSPCGFPDHTPSAPTPTPSIAIFTETRSVQLFYLPAGWPRTLLGRTPRLLQRRQPEPAARCVS